MSRWCLGDVCMVTQPKLPCADRYRERKPRSDVRARTYANRRQVDLQSQLLLLKRKEARACNRIEPNRRIRCTPHQIPEQSDQLLCARRKRGGACHGRTPRWMAAIPPTRL